MDKLTEQDIREGLALSDKATPRPWDTVDGYCHKCDGWHFEGSEDVGGTGICVSLRGGHDQFDDIAYILHAANNYPRALRQLAETQRELATARDERDRAYIKLGSMGFESWSRRLMHPENFRAGMDTLNDWKNLYYAIAEAEASGEEKGCQ